MSLEELRQRLRELDSRGPIPTTVTSVRLPVPLRDALRLAVDEGLDATVNEATVEAVRLRLELFLEGRALAAHLAAYPELTPSLQGMAQMAAEVDDHYLRGRADLIARAATEIVRHRPDATPDDVLVYAEALANAEEAA